MTEKQTAQQMKEIMAKNIQKFLDKKGVDQTEMANALEFPESTVSNWMTATTYPRLDKIQAMADYFNIYRSDLIEDKSEIQTLAAHHDGDDWTKEELDELEQFKAYVRSKRQNK